MLALHLLLLRSLLNLSHGEALQRVSICRVRSPTVSRPYSEQEPLELAAEDIDVLLATVCSEGAHIAAPVEVCGDLAAMTAVHVPCRSADVSLVSLVTG